MSDRERGLTLFLKRLTTRSKLTAEEQDAILALPGEPTEILANHDFVRMGERVDHACLVVDGLAARFAQTASGERQIIALHLPGDMVDLHSVVAPHTSLPLQALSRILIVRVPHAALIAITDQYPAVGRAFWRDAIVDVSLISQSLLSLGRRRAASRLAHLYCELAVRSGHLNRNDDADIAQSGAAIVPEAFAFPATQYHIADILGLTPVHVNRTLRLLREAGLVEANDGWVRILDWKGLTQIAEFDPSYLQLERVELHARARRG